MDTVRLRRRCGALLAILFVTILAPGAQAAVGDHRWSAGYDVGGGASAVDGTGHVASAGTFFSSLDLGGGTFTPGNIFGGDIFLARFDTDGNHVWSQQFTPGGFGATLTHVAAGPTGSIYIAGAIQGDGTVDFGGGTLSGSGNTYLAAFDASGNHLWSFTAGAGFVRSLVADGPNVVCTGYTYGSMDFGGGSIGGAGDADLFVASVSATTGGHTWSAAFGDAAGQGGMAAAIAPGGNVILAASTESAVDFGGGPLAPNGVDLCLVAFNASGAHQWSQIFDGVFSSGSGILLQTALDVSIGGDIAMAGQMNGSVDFGGGTLTSNGSGDMYVAVFDGAGGHQWSAGYGGSATDLAGGVAFDTDGNVLVSGLFLSANVSFGGGTFSPVGFGSDFFAALYDDTGGHLWSAAYGQNGQWDIRADCDPDGNFFLTGGASGGIDFGGGALSAAGLFNVEFEGAAVPSAVDLPAAKATLAQNVPNPFNPSTTIAFTLHRRAQTTVRIFDVRGTLVATLVDAHLGAGTHERTWNGRGDDGRPVPAACISTASAPPGAASPGRWCS
jgi:hypothetical protein